MGLFPTLVLASGSPRRLALLSQAGIEPDRIMPMEVDETPQRAEHPRSLAKRLAEAKARAAFDSLAAERAQHAAADPDAKKPSRAERESVLVLGSDTVVSVGRRIIGKAETLEEASEALGLLSGRSHRVYTGIALLTRSGKLRQRLVETRVRFKRLGAEEIEGYLASGEWRGKAGGYAIQGLAGAFVQKLSGSYTNVVGLPLFETVNLLVGEGYKVHLQWLQGR